ncbi:hypothetical protein MVES1_000923 [Malassezia vespertilionis]|nr:uncharacterized protein MVES1_000923 [Malassezia vespertilionis]WFD05593.1 hypothetical protein MVES1_000923 [Malassezia vespertilionis]
MDWEMAGTEGAALFPCIHALYFERSATDSTLLPLAERAAEAQAPPFSSLEETRASLIAYLSACLGGDRLAAEYLLLALLAKIHLRRPGLAVGSLSLNISGMHGESKQHPALYHALTSLVPALVPQRLALDVLNDPQLTLFVRSADTGIIAGRLELAQGTMVLVDEVCMGEGQLQDHGVRNIRALASVLQSHTLPYLFPFSEFHFDTDLNVVVLSAGKSLLPVDLHVPLRTSDGASSLDMYSTEGMPLMPPEVYMAWRVYLLRARHLEFQVTEPVSESIQHYFVEQRSVAGADAYTQEDLQRDLGIARLLSVSHGASELTEPFWRDAVAMGKARAARQPL